MRTKHPFPATIHPSIVLLLIGFFSLFRGDAVAQRNNPVEKRQDMSFLADSSVLTKSDYLFHLEKVFEIINKVPGTVASFTKLSPIESHLSQDEAAIALLKNRLLENDRGLNLQNLQMYQTLLDELQSNNKDCLQDLQDYEKQLNELKTGVLNLRKDSVLLKIFRTDSLRTMFKDQFKELRQKRVVMDSLIKGNTLLINNLEARTSANLIAIKELVYHTEEQLKSVGAKAFGKEKRYLWESSNKPAGKRMGFRKFLNGEQQISQYYFLYTRDSRLFLLLTGAVFFLWVFFNFQSLIRRQKLEELKDFNFSFLSPRPYLITLILILVLAPVFDLRAPALYVEGIHVFLAICLSIVLYKDLPREWFYKWCIFVLFLLAPIVLRILGLSSTSQRWLLLLSGSGAAAYGIWVLKTLGTKARMYKVLSGAGLLYVLFTLIAILCNLFGRFTLTQLFYTTGVAALLDAVSLTILTAVMVEAFLLQMKSSRIRKNYPEYFDWKPVLSGVQRLVGTVAFVIWLVLFTTNLNIFNELYDDIMAVFIEKRTIGSFSFTFGGIVLFLGIIWVANLLQKYIAYFFGDTGEDSLDDNKGERSKLLVTRLVLLIGGFLIAVAASGLPIDKITVILGALGVGIGLGLQNIVSNFVSGVILIFDKTIRIGDVVELSNKKGRVKEIGVRASTLMSDEGAEIIIPNGAILSNNIINWTLSNNHMRVDMALSVAKPFDPEEALRLIKEAIYANANVFLNKEPKIMISPINVSSSSIKIYFWCKDILLAESTKSTINAQIFESLENNGIDIL